MHIEILQERGILSLFEIFFDGDDTPYRMWSIDETHAIQEAIRISNALNTLLPLTLHSNQAHMNGSR